MQECHGLEYSAMAPKVPNHHNERSCGLQTTNLARPTEKTLLVRICIHFHRISTWSPRSVFQLLLTSRRSTCEWSVSQAPKFLQNQFLFYILNPGPHTLPPTFELLKKLSHCLLPILRRQQCSDAESMSKGFRCLNAVALVLLDRTWSENCLSNSQAERCIWNQVVFGRTVEAVSRWIDKMVENLEQWTVSWRSS